ncbi:MAG: hypothetical protein ABIP17_15770 [Ilumatobacteraceae bacterium]
MIVVLAAASAPRLTDVERFDRLHAELHGDLDDARLEPLCRRSDEPGHVWLRIAEARARGADASSGDDFNAGFDAMIEYAASHGWLDAAGTHVRAHVRSV